MYLPVTQYYSPNVILVVAFKYGTPLAESFSKVPKNLLDRLSHNFKMEKFEINEIKLYYRERRLFRIQTPGPSFPGRGESL